MPNAARMGDAVSHNSPLSRSVAGMFLGAMVAVSGVGVAVLVTVGTGGLLATAILGAAVGLGIGSLMPKKKTGYIITGSPNVFVNGMPAARVELDYAQCSDHSGKQQIVTGSANFFINGKPAARVGDKIACGAVIIEGSPNFNIGGDTVSIEPPPEPDIYDLWRAKRDAEIMENMRMQQNSGATIPNDARDGCPAGKLCIDPGKVAQNVNMNERQLDMNPMTARRVAAPRSPGIQFGSNPNVPAVPKPPKDAKLPFPPPVDKVEKRGDENE